MSRILQILILRQPFAIHQLHCFTSYKNLSTVSRKVVELNLEKDVTKNYVLYQADYVKSLYKVQLLSFGSFALWLYLALFTRDFVTDEPASIEKKKIEESGRGEDSNLYATWSKFTHFPDKFRWSLIACCCVMAYGSLFLTGTYISKCVQNLTLMKGGREVLVKTPFSLVFLPKLMERTYPITHFSSVVSREHAKNFIPIKIKGKPLYYLLKKDGEFPNPLLFDKTVGRKRKL